MALTVKTDDVTRGRKDVDPHGRFRGEWVKLQMNLTLESMYEIPMVLQFKRNFFSITFTWFELVCTAKKFLDKILWCHYMKENSAAGVLHDTVALEELQRGVMQQI